VFRKKIVQNHLLFWLVLLGSFALIQFFKDGNSVPFYRIFFENLKRLPAMMLSTYVFNYVLLPRFYNEKRWVLFWSTTILLFYFSTALDRFINIYIFETLFREGDFTKESIFEILADWTFLLTGYFAPIALATFTLTFSNVIDKKNEMEKRMVTLERDKNRIQLNALKSQIHPHFLFNTLNNLYALTLQKSDKAPETVATLSEMLDYMLYQCDAVVVPLEKEIVLLKNYIKLEQLRYGEEVVVKFDVEEKISSLKIAPFILLSILENAFKHGVSGVVQNPQINVHLGYDNLQLHFEVKNTFNEIESEDFDQYRKGIGVSNITKQLELLYPDYSYEVHKENGWYCVALRINTAQAYD